jgi:hypothetical protein
MDPIAQYLGYRNFDPFFSPDTMKELGQDQNYGYVSEEMIIAMHDYWRVETSVLGNIELLIDMVINIRELDVSLDTASDSLLKIKLEEISPDKKAGFHKKKKKFFLKHRSDKGKRKEC